MKKQGTLLIVDDNRNILTTVRMYKVKFMNEPDINTHLRITLGRPEQNRIVIDTIKKIALQ